MEGFPTPPPYPILMVDDLRDSARSVRRAVDNAQAKLALTENMAQHDKVLLNTTDKRLRQASEELESARDPVRAAGLCGSATSGACATAWLPLPLRRRKC